MTIKVKLQNVRIAFAQLFEGKAFEGSDKKNFSAAFAIDPKSPVVKELDDAMVMLAKEKWEKRGDAILGELIAGRRVCFQHRPKTNASGETFDGFEGMFFLNSSRPEDKGRPLVIDANKAPLTPADGKPYSGCYVNATVDLWAQDNKFGKRINATLLAVQFARDGEAFSGGSTGSVDDFEEVEVAETADDLI